MKTNVYLAVSIMLIFGCSNSENKTQKLSVNETYNTTVNTDIVKGNQDEEKLRVRVESNTMLDSIHPNVSSAQIALLSYMNLTKEEQSSLKFVDIEYLKNETIVNSYTYPFENFPVITSKFEVFKELSQFIVDGKYKALDEVRNTTSVRNGIAKALEQKMRFLNKHYGKLRGFKTFGLSEEGDQDGRAYQFQAYLEFDKRQIPYFFYLDTTEGKDQWLGFSVKN